MVAIGRNEPAQIRFSEGSCGGAWYHEAAIREADASQGAASRQGQRDKPALRSVPSRAED